MISLTDFDFKKSYIRHQTWILIFYTRFPKNSRKISQLYAKLSEESLHIIIFKNADTSSSSLN